MLASLLSLQLVSRLLTFILNQALFRIVSPESYGVASIQFDLILSSILFLSREGVRGALLRTRQQQNQGFIAFVPLLIGIPLSLALSTLYSSSATQETTNQPYFRAALGLYVLAALVELLNEPKHNANVDKPIRVRAEGAGVVVKAAATFSFIYSYPNATLLGFAFGQLSYALTLVIVYGLPRIPSTSDTDKKTLSLASSLTAQSLVKHLLTEGDKVVLSYFSPLQDQAGYALAANYGGLIPRIVFQPIEETMRMRFTSMRGGELRVLEEALSPIISLSILFTTFASLYFPIFIPVLLPPRYMATSAPQILYAYIFYMPILALNGVMEAYWSSVADRKEVVRQSGYLVLFSAVYIATALAMYDRAGMGDVAFVYANIINLGARILYVFSFIRRERQRRDAESKKDNELQLGALVPSPLFILSLAVSWAVVKANEKPSAGLKGLALHVGLGGSLGVMSLGVWYSSWRRTRAKAKVE